MSADTTHGRSPHSALGQATQSRPDAAHVWQPEYDSISAAYGGFTAQQAMLSIMSPWSAPNVAECIVRGHFPCNVPASSYGASEYGARDNNVLPSPNHECFSTPQQIVSSARSPRAPPDTSTLRHPNALDHHAGSFPSCMPYQSFGNADRASVHDPHTDMDSSYDELFNPSASTLSECDGSSPRRELLSALDVFPH